MGKQRPSPKWALEANALDELLATLEGLHRAVVAGFALPRVTATRNASEDRFGFSTNHGDGMSLPGQFVDKAIQDLCRRGSDCERNYDALLTRATLLSVHELFKEYLGIGYADHNRTNDEEEFNASRLGALGWAMRDAVSDSAAGHKTMKDEHDFWFIKIEADQEGLYIQAGSVLAYLGELDKLAREKFTGELG